MEQQIDPVAYARETRTPVFARARIGIVGSKVDPDHLRKLVADATADCEALLARDGATGAYFREPRVDPLAMMPDAAGPEWVVSVARYFPGDEPKASTA